jgi:hypothetical protein
MPPASAAARRRTHELEPLTGLAAIDAIARLRSRELRPAVESCEGGPEQHGVVVAQEPAAGAEVARGQLVTLIVAEQQTHRGRESHCREATAHRTDPPRDTRVEVPTQRWIDAGAWVGRLIEPLEEDATLALSINAADTSRVGQSHLGGPLLTREAVRDAGAMSVENPAASQTDPSEHVIATAPMTAASEPRMPGRSRRRVTCTAPIAAAAVLAAVLALTTVLVRANPSAPSTTSAARRTSASPPHVPRTEARARTRARARIEPGRDHRARPRGVAHDARQHAPGVTGTRIRTVTSRSTGRATSAIGRGRTAPLNRIPTAAWRAPQAVAAAPAARPSGVAASASPTEPVAPTGPVPGPPPSQ